MQRPVERRLICVHGAGTRPSVFDDWSGDFPGWELEALDLLEGLDPATATMSDHAASVVAATMQSRCHVAAVCGWSMGGLVALMAARLACPAAVVVIEPSLPAELKQARP